MTIHECSRRKFLKETTGLALAATLPALVMRCTSKSNPAAPPAGSSFTVDTTAQAYTALATVGGSAYANTNTSAGTLIVIRKSQTEITALSSVCTHAGCTVGLPANQQLQCPCHLSVYNEDGSNVSGPAPQPLRSYPAVLAGTVITITL
jgi:cytochrome b6-f complex iron-sulfur subunit